MEKINPNLKNIPPLKTRRRELRANSTAAEHVLWQNLRGRRLLGTKFRRQYSIGRYVVDFFCSTCNLAIELDGQPHFDVLRAEYDQERTRFLEKHGVRMLRFENRSVFENLEGVLETIRVAIQSGRV
jgi:very-short-patch-repair endonuclease